MPTNNEIRFKVSKEMLGKVIVCDDCAESDKIYENKIMDEARADECEKLSTRATYENVKQEAYKEIFAELDKLKTHTFNGVYTSPEFLAGYNRALQLIDLFKPKYLQE